MKKLFAMLLALAMLLAFVACDDGSSLPPAETVGEVGTDNDTETEAIGNDTEDVGGNEDEDDEYYPNPDAKLGGMIGIGTETGTVYFDNLKVLSRQSDKYLLLENDLEDGALPEFTYAVSVGGTWDKDTADFAIVDDPAKEYTEEDADEDRNHVIAFNGDGTGSFAYVGDANWNYYQFSLKVFPADENAVVNIYFCIQDENNYMVLSLAENGNTQADCYQVIDGVKTSAAFKINNSLSVGEWNSIGITLQTETVDIYIGGAQKMSIFDPDFVNQYYSYDGEIIPSSISDALYGAPGEGITFFQVAVENVLHDGKGTWGNSTSMTADKVFDMDYSTAYDCDEGLEYENTDAEMIGIPGDGTHADAYVGAYVPEGFKLTHIRYCPRSGYGSRMLNGYFEVSEDGTNWTNVGTVSETPAESDFTTLAVAESDTVYYYLRYTAPDGGYGNVAEIEIWGHPAN